MYYEKTERELWQQTSPFYTLKAVPRNKWGICFWSFMHFHKRTQSSILEVNIYHSFIYLSFPLFLVTGISFYLEENLPCFFHPSWSELLPFAGIWRSFECAWAFCLCLLRSFWEPLGKGVYPAISIPQRLAWCLLSNHFAAGKAEEKQVKECAIYQKWQGEQSSSISLSSPHIYITPSFQSFPSRWSGGVHRLCMEIQLQGAGTGNILGYLPAELHNGARREGGRGKEAKSLPN